MFEDSMVFIRDTLPDTAKPENTPSRCHYILENIDLTVNDRNNSDLIIFLTNLESA